MSGGGGGHGREVGLTFLAFLSGACALGYEVLYLRHLTPVLGDALHVHAALLSTFLLGVGAGSWLAWRGRRRLALVQALTGAYALLLPLLTATLREHPLLPWLAERPAATALATALLVAPGAFLVGVALPLFSAYVKAARSREAAAFPDVYAGYNLGAVAGVLLVELALVRQVGILGGLRVLAVTNLGVALALVRIAGEDAKRPEAPARTFPPQVVAAVLVASAASAVTQMLLLRSMDLVLEPHRGNFAMGLAVILAGIAAGSWLVGRTRLSFSDALLLVPLPLLGAFFLAVSPVGLLHGGPAAAQTATAALLSRLAYAALLGFVPMALFGATLPALMRGERAAARESGRLLGLAGAANAAGYLLYVGALAPRLPAGVVLGLVALAAVVAAALAADGAWGVARKGLAGAGLLAAVGVGGTWDDVDFHMATRRGDVGPADTVRIFRWGGESATLVASATERWISYNGHPSIRASTEGIVNTAELVSGVVPALAAPSLGRAAVLGLGSGITAGAAARVFDTVDVAEINGAFRDMAPWLRFESLDVLGAGGARLHLGDGRAFLVGKEGVYDAVVNSVPAPTYYSAGKVYTVDFYRTVRRALRPGGVFATWISAADMTEAGVDVVVRALAEVFPHCALWLLREDYLMAVCGVEPPAFRDPETLPLEGPLARRLQEGLPGLRPSEVLEDLLLTPDLLAAGGVAPGPRNTDDRPVLEFLVLGRREVGGGGDGGPLTADPARWGIDLAAGAAGLPPERLARRARAYELLDPDLFFRAFAPLLEADTAAARAWAALREGER